MRVPRLTGAHPDGGRVTVRPTLPGCHQVRHYPLNGQDGKVRRKQKLFPLLSDAVRPVVSRGAVGLISESPRSGLLSLAPVSAKELKERAFQGVL